MTKIAIVGLGLIGGSLAKSIKKKQPGTEIYGCDSKVQTIEDAFKSGLIKNKDVSISSLPNDCDFVFIAAPIEHTEPLIMECLSHFNLDTVVVDCASVKQKFTDAVHDARFVGTHPIAGSEHTGFAHASDALVEGATFIVCPSKGNEINVEKTGALLRSLDFQLLFLSPETHDSMLAMTSHLPYLMASVLAHLTEDNTPLKSVVGPGFMSTTRVASSSPHWGADVLLANKVAMKSLINQTKSRLATIEKALNENDRDTLFEFFEAAKNQRDDLID